MRNTSVKRTKRGSEKEEAALQASGCDRGSCRGMLAISVT